MNFLQHSGKIIDFQDKYEDHINGKFRYNIWLDIAGEEKRFSFYRDESIPLRIGSDIL